MTSNASKLVEAARQAARKAQEMGINGQECPPDLWTRWTDEVVAPLNAEMGARLEKLRESAREPVLMIWAEIMMWATNKATHGQNELFLLLKEDPHLQLIELRRILDEDGFTHNITGHLAAVGDETGYGVTISW